MLTTPPFAPSTLQALHRLGIRSQEELRRTGAVKTFLLLKASGRTPTRSVLWQLAAACLGCDVMQLSDTDKTALLAAVKTHPPVALPPAEEAARFMRLALNQAEAAAAAGEVPVGAVVVRNGEVLSTAHTRCVADCDIGGHAELRALARAGRKTGRDRPPGGPPPAGWPPRFSFGWVAAWPGRVPWEPRRSGGRRRRAGAGRPGWDPWTGSVGGRARGAATTTTDDAREVGSAREAARR